MKTIRKALSLLPPMILWLMLCVLVWGFAFTRITDAPKEDKLVLFVDAEVRDSTALSVRLEEGLGDRVRMVQARPFSYAMFGGDALRSADLFIVPLKNADLYSEWFAPLPASLADRPDVITIGGGAQIGRAHV